MILYIKSLNFLLPRIKSTKEEVEEEILSCAGLEFAEKQERGNETRYVLFFIYSRRKGRVYVLKFNDKINVITAFPLGKRTLKKYRKRRFIKQ